MMEKLPASAYRIPLPKPKKCTCGSGLKLLHHPSCDIYDDGHKLHVNFIIRHNKI